MYENLLITRGILVSKHVVYENNNNNVDESDVRKAVLSSPAGSSGGHDGLRLQHLKDLVQCRESGSDLLTALTAFVNLMMLVIAQTTSLPHFLADV